MAELIDKKAFIEDIKTEIVNLGMDGLKGTPRDRSYLYEMIERINEQPTTTEAELRANVIEEFAEKMKGFCERCTIVTDFITNRPKYDHEDGEWHDLINDVVAQMKGEKKC